MTQTTLMFCNQNDLNTILYFIVPDIYIEAGLTFQFVM